MAAAAKLSSKRKKETKTEAEKRESSVIESNQLKNICKSAIIPGFSLLLFSSVRRNKSAQPSCFGTEPLRTELRGARRGEPALKPPEGSGEPAGHLTEPPEAPEAGGEKKNQNQNQNQNRVGRKIMMIKWIQNYNKYILYF